MVLCHQAEHHGQANATDALGDLKQLRQRQKVPAHTAAACAVVTLPRGRCKGACGCKACGLRGLRCRHLALHAMQVMLWRMHGPLTGATDCDFIEACFDCGRTRWEEGVRVEVERCRLECRLEHTWHVCKEVRDYVEATARDIYQCKAYKDLRFPLTAKDDVPEAQAEERCPYATLRVDAVPGTLRFPSEVLAHQLLDIDLIAVITIIPVQRRRMHSSAEGPGTCIGKPKLAFISTTNPLHSGN